MGSTGPPDRPDHPARCGKAQHEQRRGSKELRRNERAPDEGEQLCLPAVRPCGRMRVNPVMTVTATAAASAPLVATWTAA